MKSKFKFLAALFVVLTNGVLIFGQEKTIEKKEFEEIVKQANNKLEGKTYRTISTYESFDDRNSTPTKSSKSTTETVPPDRYRWIDETEKGKTELIAIGARRFIKENNGEWKEDAAAGMGGGMGCGAQIEYESYKIIGNSKISGKTVNLYEKNQKLKNNSCGSGYETGIQTNRYWISKDGFLIKTESLYEAAGEKSLRRYITIYEYDPKIKIEAPVIGKQLKQ